MVNFHLSKHWESNGSQKIMFSYSKMNQLKKLLKKIATVFNLLGFIALFVIEGKVLLQDGMDYRITLYGLRFCCMDYRIMLGRTPTVAFI